MHLLHHRFRVFPITQPVFPIKNRVWKITQQIHFFEGDSNDYEYLDNVHCSPALIKYMNI